MKLFPDLSITYPDNLPVCSRIADIKEALAKHQVLIVAGETGSGKTTQLPKICLELGRGRKGLIGHTQPRRLAARSVSLRIAEELGVEQGTAVAYQVRFTDTSSDTTMLKVMTDGILLAETRNDPLLKRYDTIIIDEAHERSLNIDFLLGYLKRILPKRPDLKLIITSATIDVELFSAHFDNAPVIEVSGRSFPVDILYRPPLEAEAEEDLGEQVLAAFREIREREKQQRPAWRDVLVFLSGEREIREVADTLRKQQMPDLEVLPLYARLSNAEQQRVFAPHSGRRIVLTTNVAETSLTVPGIGYVIDSGTARISRYSVRSKIQRLPVEAISQASANQRAGRCGRLCPGLCIRLYSEEDFVQRPEFTDTEITRTNLASVILQMLSLRLGDIERFPFLEAPDGPAIRDGFKLLEELQAVDAQGRLTENGRLMARLPLDPRLARVLVEASRLDCLREILIVVSALACQDPRERPLDKQQAADEAHRRYYHQESDFLSWVNLWDAHEEQRQQLGSSALRRHCQKQFLSPLRMREWREVHRQLLLQCHEMKLKPNKQPADYDTLHMALLSGFLSQVARRVEDGSWLGARSRKYEMFRGSTLKRSKCRWIVSGELVETSKLFARMNARVEPEWIERMGAHLLKHEYFNPFFDLRRGQVGGYEKVSIHGLILVEKRRINYARIDPVVSRELFIREGLCLMQARTRAEFHAHNKTLVESIQALEERSRRRDLLVDEQHLMAWYEERLPAEVVDVPSLERWYRKQDGAGRQRLFMQESDLLINDTELVDPQQFPERMQFGALRLDLGYVFEPGKDSDGVSIEVPVTALKQLKNEDLDWLVPGLLREKCAVLIRALPKQLRKQLVPIPDTVERILPALKREDGSLKAALARQLLRDSLVQIPLDVWDAIALPTHLEMLVKVVDESGKLLDSGRDLQQMKERLGAMVQAGISRAAEDSMERKGLVVWDFGELPEQRSVNVDKLQIQAWPALADRGDSVDLVLLDSAYKAQLSSVWGVTRLLMLASRQQLRYLQKELLQNPAQLRHWRELAPRDQLVDQLLLRAYSIAFRVEEQLPRSETAFKACLQAGSNKVIAVAQELEALLYRILALHHQVRARLQRGFSGPQEKVCRADIENQLGHLIHPQFLLHTPWLQMQQLPRFLQAVESRMEKYAAQTTRDTAWSQLMDKLWRQYQERRAWCERHELADASLDDYRWLLEELRVSLFAQALGTRVPVSEKRLQKFWHEKVLG